MKMKLVTVLLCILIVVAPTQKSHAIVWVVVKAAIVKVIKAIDLGIQRQQNKIIWLQNAQKTLENAMAKLKLDEISDWTSRQREQYKKYFDELQQVKALITHYQRLKEITRKQTRIVTEYQRAWGMIGNDKRFTVEEVRYMGKVYAGILDETLKNVDRIALVINSFRTQMSDAKRLEIINETADRVDGNYSDLLEFNRQNGMLSLQRAKGEQEVNTVKAMYGIKTVQP